MKKVRAFSVIAGRLRVGAGAVALDNNLGLQPTKSPKPSGGSQIAGRRDPVKPSYKGPQRPPRRIKPTSHSSKSR